MSETKVAEALLRAYNVIKRVWLKLRCDGFQALRHGDASFTSESSIFSVMDGWIAEVLFLLYFAYILLCNRPNIVDYEAHWLMGFQIINP